MDDLHAIINALWRIPNTELRRQALATHRAAQDILVRKIVVLLTALDQQSITDARNEAAIGLVRRMVNAIAPHK